MNEDSIDWSGCPFVEIDPNRVGGRPVVKGTRMPAEDIVANYEYGVSVEEIAEQFQIAPAILQELLSYAEGRHPVAGTPR